MNLVLGDVVETIYTVDEDDEDEEIRVSLLHYIVNDSANPTVQTTTKKSEMLFVRGRLSPF